MDSDEKNSANLWFLDRNMEPEYDDDDDDDFSHTFATLYAEAEGSDGDDEIDKSLELEMGLNLGMNLDVDLLPSDIFQPSARRVQDNAEKEKKKVEREKAGERERDEEKERERIRQKEKQERKESEKQKQKEIEKQKAREEEMLKGLDDPAWLEAFFGILPKQGENMPPEPDEFETLREESVDSKDIDEWIKAEGLNDPLSDIPEYNMLLDLAVNYEKNYDVLFKVLTPTTVIENSETEGEMMETGLLSPSPPPPFEISPESPDILMLSPEPMTPAGEPDIDMDSPSTSMEALKALSLAGTPKKAMRPVPNFGSFTNTQSDALERDNFLAEVFPMVLASPVTPKNRAMAGTPKNRGVLKAMAVTPADRGVTPVTPRVVPAIPGVPTGTALPDTPTDIKVMPSMPSIAMFEGASPGKPASATVKEVKTALPGTPNLKGVVPRLRVVPGTPGTATVEAGTPVAKKPETPKPTPKPGLRVDKERPSTSKEARKALARANEFRAANETAALFMLNARKKPSVANPESKLPVHSSGRKPPQVTLEDLPPPLPLVVLLPPLPSPVPPPPDTEAEDKMKAWLQLCNIIVVKQVQYIEAKEKMEKSEGKLAEGSILKSSVLDIPTTAIFDGEFLGYSKQQATTLSAKWFQQFGDESVNNLRRSVVLPFVQPDPMPSHRLSFKIRIIKRPPKREILCVDLKYTNFYCIMNLNSPLNLRVSAGALDRAVFKRSIDVVQHSFDTIRITWIWADGTVMIINGYTQEALVETQHKLVPKLVDLNWIGAAPKVEINYLSLISQTKFPWSIDLRKFSQAATPCEPLFCERHVYYVAKDMPGVVARVHESGEVQVFAMSMDLADTMLTRLYPILYNHRVNTALG